LVVCKLDRLARSTLDLLRIIDRIEKEGAGFSSLGDPWADTATPHGKLMLMIFGGIAEFERSLILQRTDEGRARTSPHLRVRIFPDQFEISFRSRGHSGKRLLASSASRPGADLSHQTQLCSELS
jgi:hypothetical protein